MSENERSGTRTLNAELAWRALDTARAKGKLNMASWFEGEPHRSGELTPEQLLNENVCGTTACHAGWVVALSGYTIRHAPWVPVVIAADGSSPGRVNAVARDLLGISDEEAQYLFIDTDEEGIEGVIAEIFGPRPEPSQNSEAAA